MSGQTDSMLEKLNGIEERYETLGREMLEVGSDYQRAGEINKERLDLEPVVIKSRQYRQALKSRQEAREILETESDPELRSLAESDVSELEPKIEALEKEIKGLLVPKDPRDDKSVIVEVRAGTGATKLPCSPRICFACTTATPSGAGGNRRSCLRTRSASAATRK